MYQNPHGYQDPYRSQNSYEYQNPHGYQDPYRSQNSYEYQNPHGYQDPYRSPDSYEYQNPYRYPNHNYEYPYNYDNRVFADKIGKYYTLTKPLSLPEYNYTIPANTRIFIHNVAITSTGQELVTIVAPIQKGGNLVNETIKNIPATQL
ncbi:hypothetical protein [Bacillus toyonensis]|uniref:hypothetical protein n=1 Tax=Bacillus toyonensis TaxID=155322 RepID=UPI000330D1A6|nr:hypothetical protein [Bacillus toyonensis]EOP20094.1 hypothetical protein IIS_06030 [Bacillus cereus VD131]